MPRQHSCFVRWKILLSLEQYEYPIESLVKWAPGIYPVSCMCSYAFTLQIRGRKLFFAYGSIFCSCQYQIDLIKLQWNWTMSIWWICSVHLILTKERPGRIVSVNVLVLINWRAINQGQTRFMAPYGVTSPQWVPQQSAPCWTLFGGSCRFRNVSMREIHTRYSLQEWDVYTLDYFRV